LYQPGTPPSGRFVDRQDRLGERPRRPVAKPQLSFLMDNRFGFVVSVTVHKI